MILCCSIYFIISQLSFPRLFYLEREKDVLLLQDRVAFLLITITESYPRLAKLGNALLPPVQLYCISFLKVSLLQTRTGKNNKLQSRKIKLK